MELELSSPRMEARRRGHRGHHQQAHRRRRPLAGDRQRRQRRPAGLLPPFVIDTRHGAYWLATTIKTTEKTSYYNIHLPTTLFGSTPCRRSPRTSTSRRAQTRRSRSSFEAIGTSTSPPLGTRMWTPTATTTSRACWTSGGCASNSPWMGGHHAADHHKPLDAPRGEDQAREDLGLVGSVAGEGA